MRAEAIVNRARRAYYVAAQKAGVEAPVPDPRVSGLYKLYEREYVVLRSVNTVYAVYRLRNDGKLKKLKRVPKQLLRM